MIAAAMRVDALRPAAVTNGAPLPTTADVTYHSAYNQMSEDAETDHCRITLQPSWDYLAEHHRKSRRHAWSIKYNIRHRRDAALIVRWPAHNRRRLRTGRQHSSGDLEMRLKNTEEQISVVTSLTRTAGLWA